MRRSCLALSLAAAAFAPSPLDAATTFRVTVPGNTPAGDTVFVAGDFQGWVPGDPAHALSRQPDGRWTGTFDFAQGTAIQFKFNRGDWARVEKGASGEEIPDRTHTPNGSETLDLSVATWADLGTVTGRVDSLSHPPFLAGRRCWIYLPPGYEESTDRYPVLYMHDGQNLFNAAGSFAGEWRVDEACEALIRSGEIEPIIVVGIENSAARCVEYTPWPDLTPDPAVPCQGGGGDLYLQAIRDHLMPEIDRRYRTRTGPENSYMAGSSLGGLISHYAGYAYDDVWGRIAPVSTYFPWADGMLLTWAAARPKPNLARFYQDMGTLEFGFTDADADGVDDFIEALRAMRDIAVGQGFVEGVDFLSVEGQNHTHWEYWWAVRMPDLLRFLIDPGPTASVRPGPAAAAVEFLQPAPVPASGPVRLEFTLAAAARVRVSIVDVSGRRVATLADAPYPAGRHAITWQGRERDGGRVRPGIYWATLDAGGRTFERKLVVVR